jgi:transcriptional regulator with PAS, ATPase and Fis domain
VAQSDDTTVLIVGESGTGKELAARAVHALSGRRRAPLVEIDCAAIPGGLLESELFGHERGAFTGAVRQKRGLLELAGDGTAFLDEIGDLDLALQGKLLRVLQERAFYRVGGTRKVHFGARVVAATNRDLGRAIAEGRFREDLYHRLSAFPLEMPPLRAREGDVEILANHFIAELNAKLGKRVGPVAGRTLDLLVSYEFPGNVRELRNIVEQAMILCSGPELTPDLLPERVRGAGARLREGGNGIQILFRPGVDTLDEVNRELLRRALELCGGRKTRAAELLGISRYALNRKCEKYGLRD